MGTRDSKYEHEYEEYGDYEQEAHFEKYTQKRRRKTFKEHRRVARLKKQQQRDKGLMEDERYKS